MPDLLGAANKKKPASGQPGAGRFSGNYWKTHFFNARTSRSSFSLRSSV
jgi:hypothetical protein